MREKRDMVLFDFDSTLSSVEMFDVLGMVVEICEARHHGSSLGFDYEIFFDEYFVGNYNHRLQYQKSQSYDTLLTFQLKAKIESNNATLIFSSQTINSYKNNDKTYNWFYQAVVELLTHYGFGVDLLARIGNFILNNYIANEKIALIKKLKQQNIYTAIASGGFYDIIKPIADHLDIDLFAVSIAKQNGKLLSLVHDGFNAGKDTGLKNALNYSQYDRRIIVGDGSNDYDVFNSGICDKWIAYTEIHQHNFHNKATCQASNFYEVESYLADFLIK